MAIQAKNIIDKIAYEIGDTNLTKSPPRVYLDLLNHAIRNVFNWLTYKDIYFEFLSESIITVVNQEQYNVIEGKTIAIYNNTIKIIEKAPQYKLNFYIPGVPQYYFTTIKKIGFIPIPNAIFTLKRHYIPFPSTILSFDTDILFPEIFEKLLILESCLQTIKLGDDIEWLKTKTELFAKWEKEKEVEQRLIYNYYPPIKESRNLFID